MITEQARRFNDGSLEFAIAFGRVTSLLNLLYAVGALAGRWWWPALVTSMYALGMGWLSWWYFGNSSWRGCPVRVCDKPGPDGLACNVAITEDNMTHVGLHADGLRDPEGARWWR